MIIPRWTAAGVLKAESNFHKMVGYRALAQTSLQHNRQSNRNLRAWALARAKVLFNLPVLASNTSIALIDDQLRIVSHIRCIQAVAIFDIDDLSINKIPSLRCRAAATCVGHDRQGSRNIKTARTAQRKNLLSNEFELLV